MDAITFLRLLLSQYPAMPKAEIYFRYTYDPPYVRVIYTVDIHEERLTTAPEPHCTYILYLLFVEPAGQLFFNYKNLNVWPDKKEFIS
jgi:hypothetical protein